MHFEEFAVQEPLDEWAEEGYGHAHPLCENCTQLRLVRLVTFERRNMGRLKPSVPSPLTHFDEPFILRPRAVLTEVGYDNRHPFCANHLEVLGD